MKVSEKSRFTIMRTALVLVGLGLVAHGWSQVQPAKTDRLFYAEHRRDGTTIIWALDPTAPQNPTTLLRYQHEPGYGGTFALSPDAGKLLYTRATSEPTRELRLFDIIFKRDQLLSTSLDNLTALQWDGSSSVIAYTRPSGTDNTALVTLDIKTMKDSVLLNSSAAMFWPLGWSQFGDEIFYYTILNSTHQIRAVSITGHDRLVISLGSIHEVNSVRDFRLSADRQELLCQVLKPTGSSAIIVDLNMQTTREVITSDSELFGLGWAPNRSFVYSIKGHPGQPIRTSIPRQGAPVHLVRRQFGNTQPSNDELDILVSESSDAEFQVIRRIRTEAGRISEHYEIVDHAGSRKAAIDNSNDIDIIGWIRQ